MTRALVAVVLATLTPSAYAGDLGDEPVVELLGVDEARADGRSEHNVYLLTLDDDGDPLTNARFKASASLGALSAPLEVAPGLFRLRYTPPEAAHAGSDTLQVEVHAGNLHRTARRTVALVPAASSTVEIATKISASGARFSARAVSSEGLPVDEPYLVERAAAGRLEGVERTSNGLLSGRWTDVHGSAHGIITVLDAHDPAGVWGVSVTPSPGAPATVALFPLPERIPADPGAWIPVRVLAVDGAGRPDPSAKVQLHTTSGTISAPEPLGDGVFTAWLAPASSPTAGTLTVSASLGDAPPVDAIDATLVPSRGHHITLATDPADVEDGMGAVKTRVRALASDRTELIGRAVRFLGAGLIPGQVVEVGQGDYEGFLGIPEHGPVDLAATVVAPTTGLPLRHLLLLPDRDQTAGAPLVGITVLSLDALGYPVPAQTVTLDVVQGGGHIQTRVITDDTGLARAEYELGQLGSLAVVEAHASGHVATASLLQDAERHALPALPTSGAREHVEIAAGWRRALPTLSLRSAPPPLPVGARSHGRGDIGAPPPLAPKAAASASSADVRLSLAGAGSTYSMLQEPQPISSLLSTPFQVGGTDNPNATPVGGRAALRAWVGPNQIVGLRARFDGQLWSVTAPSFQGEVHHDVLVDSDLGLLARAAFTSENTRYHVAARVGAHYDDALIVMGTTTAPDFRAFHMPGLSLGAELGLTGPSASLVAGLDESFVNGTYPYRTAVDLCATAHLGGPVSAELGFDHAVRAVPIVDSVSELTLGHLSDQRTGAHLGLSIQLGAN